MEIEDKVISEIKKRQQLGIKKYGLTLSQNMAELEDRLQHLKEELLDGALYCQWAIDQIKAKNENPSS
jgi:hypothetical protein